MQEAIGSCDGYAYLERIISIASDTLIDGQQVQVQPIVVSLIEKRQDMCEHRRVWPFSSSLSGSEAPSALQGSITGRHDLRYAAAPSNVPTFTTTGPYSHPFPSPEDALSLNNRIVHLCLEHLKEAVFAHLLPRLGPLDERAGGVTERARRRCHD